jgi:hypothetical protein
MTAAARFSLEQCAEFGGLWVYPPHHFPHVERFAWNGNSMSRAFRGRWRVAELYEVKEFRPSSGFRAFVGRYVPVQHVVMELVDHADRPGRHFCAEASWLRHWRRL